jgi:Ca-activated chloride channel homolog
MIVRPGLGTACVLSLALFAAAATFGIQSLTGNSARAAQPAAAAPPAGKPIKRVKVAGSPKETIKPKEDVSAKLTRGALRVLRPDGMYAECPLKKTDVRANISGFIARVDVVQTFVNPTEERIEAVYVFPLPHNSAVDSMTMHVAGRKITGLIKRKAVAEQIYQQALRRGATAAVLHQHRPNVFQQKVGNIPPKGTVKIHISYVDVLEYDRGEYAFHFPMIVGPRYTPAGWKEDARTGGGAPGGTTNAIRSGKEISLSLKLDAGVPVDKLRSVNHKVDIKRTGETTAVCAIAAGDTIPNKDFDLRYKVIGEKPKLAVLAHNSSGKDGHFMLMVQPADDEMLKKAPPRELVFLVDVSGSMGASGIGHSKMAMRHFLKLSKPQDKVQIITFRNTATKCFEKSVLCTEENVRKARKFVDAIRAGGGTEMYKGVKEALNAELDPQRVRVVVMLTDAFIGNGPQIVQEVGKKCGDRIRMWCIGVGPRVNRNLVNSVAKQGGGMGKILSKNESEENVQKLVNEVVERIHRAQLAGITINWGGLKVYETYPARIPELWHGRPIIVHGRYTGGGEARIRISGEAEGKPVSMQLNVKLPEKQAGNDVLGTVWARKKIESLMDQIWVDGSPEMIEEVTRIALEYKLMSQYTSFVAVDEASAIDTEEPIKPPVRLPLPVPFAHGRIAWRQLHMRGEDALMYERAEGKKAEKSKRPRRDMRMLKAMTMPMPPAAAMPATKPGKSTAYRGPAAPANYARKFAQGWSGGKQQAGAYMPGGGGKGGGIGSGYAGRRRALMTRAKARPLVNYLLVDKAAKELADEKSSLDRDFSRSGRSMGFAYYGIRQGLEKQFKPGVARSEELLKAAKDEADPIRKMALLQRVYLYDYSWRALGWQTKGVAEKARAELTRLREKIAADRLATEPRLKTRLKLVVRDMSLREALSQVAAAAGLEMDLAPGAVSVASRLQNTRTIRITWMDLRGATASQAFEWLCAPAHIDWTVEKGKVRATVASLSRIKAPWTYDVSALSLPLDDEFKDLKKDKADWKKIQKRAASLTAEFIAACRKAAGTTLSEDCFWVQPGQIAVFADAAAHARVRKLLAELRSGRGEHGELGSKTLKRCEKRKEYIEKSRGARVKGEVYGVMQWSSWKLLAAASAGETDLEALTRLKVAWRHPFASKLAEGKVPLTAMRSAWVITESALALPRDKELAELASGVLASIEKHVEAALEGSAKSSNDQGAYLAGLYGYLALRNGQVLGKVSEARLAAFKPNLAKLLALDSKSPATSSLRMIGRVLLLGVGKVDGKELTRLFSTGMRGDDSNALAALAARKSGGELWLAFRAGSREYFAQNGVSGAVVLIANRLVKSPLYSAK